VRLVSKSNPSSSSIGTGVWTADFTSSDGNILIPAYYGNYSGSQWSGNADYANGDKFYFTVKRNWVDTETVDNSASGNQKFVRIYGLENKHHKLKIVQNTTDRCLLDAIKIYEPVLGRSYEQ